MSIFSQKSNEFSKEEIQLLKNKPLLERIFITVKHSITDTIPNCIDDSKFKTPCFCGSFDWHSCVHSYWSMIQILKYIPQNESYIKSATEILNTHLTKDNIKKEIENLNMKYEYPYGFAWFLSLVSAIKNSNLFSNFYVILIPLENIIRKIFLDNLLNNKNVNIIENGAHYNTAFTLILLYYYATNINDGIFLKLVKDKSLELYYNKNILKDEKTKYCFLSNNLCVLHLLSLVLEKENFLKYIELINWRIIFTYNPVSFDLNKPMECHDAGLNFSRCWNYNSLCYLIRNENDKNLLKCKAEEHCKMSENVVPVGNWVYDHYLGTFYLMGELSKITDNIFK